MIPRGWGGPFLCGAILGWLSVCTASCGVKGDPIPPERVFPQAPAGVKLEVVPEGVKVSCRVPGRNSDESPLTDLDMLELWRAGPATDDCPDCALNFRKVADIPYHYPEGAEMASGILEYVDEGVQSGEYAYQLMGVTQRGVRGSPSRKAKVYWELPPLGVVGLKVEAGDRQVEIKWNAVTERSDGEPIGEVFYEVFRGKMGTGFKEKPINDSPLSETRFIDDGLKNGITYQYRVRALREIQDQLVPGPLSDTAEATPKDIVPPEAPQGVVAFPTAEGIRLVWRGGEQEEISGYRVYRSETAEGPWMLLTDPPLSTILFEDRDVEPGQWYWYGVTALDLATPPNESEMSKPLKASLQ